ncbi:hypothetical protein BV898_06240 [Hypsibius exemplaris]|uniref:G-protein coupled receptors family 1 profile domain-containing protein n=1 Tax=Hypsibius exemplaris TaxID=2072580 RepID=A0A1W0WWW1_HYPEX|nr:hypothetical protein BV898_06240 [Hypsibius exemplaris]
MAAFYNFSLVSRGNHTTSISNSSISHFGVPAWVTYQQALLWWYVITMLICALTGTVNILLVAVIRRNRFLRSGSGLVIGHLACLECLASTINLPVHYTTMFTPQFGLKANAVSCAVMQIFMVTTYTAVDWTLLLLAVNRFVAVVFPHSYNWIASKKVSRIGLVSIWLFAISLNAPFCFDVENRFSATPPWLSCGFAQSRPGEFDFRSLQAALSVFVPLALVGPLYLSVLMKSVMLWQARMRMAPILNRNSQAWFDQRNQRRRLNTAKILFVCWSVYFVSFFWTNIINKFAGALMIRSPVVQLWSRTGFVIGYLIHPIFLFSLSTDHQKGLKSLLKDMAEYLAQVPEWVEQQVSRHRVGPKSDGLAAISPSTRAPAPTAEIVLRPISR